MDNLWILWMNFEIKHRKDRKMLKVSDILQQKIQEIQSRLPVRMKAFNNSRNFKQVMMNAVNDISKQPVGKNQDDIMKAIDKNIADASKKYDLEAALIKAVMKQESAFNPNALSKAGARGLMQLMPGTAKILGVEDIWDIRQNIDGGAMYLRDMLYAYDSNLELALAAYNAGPGNVEKYGGVPPFNETKDFIKKVMQYYNEYKN